MIEKINNILDNLKADNDSDLACGINHGLDIAKYNLKKELEKEFLPESFGFKEVDKDKYIIGYSPVGIRYLLKEDRGFWCIYHKDNNTSEVFFIIHEIRINTNIFANLLFCALGIIQ